MNQNPDPVEELIAHQDKMEERIKLIENMMNPLTSYMLENKGKFTIGEYIEVLINFNTSSMLTGLHNYDLNQSELRSASIYFMTTLHEILVRMIEDPRQYLDIAIQTEVKKGE